MKYTLAVLALIYGADALKFRPYTEGRTPWYKTTSRPNPTPWPHNYSVPNFGADSDIAGTAKNINDAEKSLKKKFNPKALIPEKAPASYTVPNFGVDKDVVQTQNSIKSAEKELNWKFKASFAQAAQPPRDYFVPNFGQDKDVEATLAHAGNAE